MAERLRCARSCPGTHDRDRYWVTIRCRGAERDFPHGSCRTSPLRFGQAVGALNPLFDAPSAETRLGARVADRRRGGPSPETTALRRSRVRPRLPDLRKDYYAIIHQRKGLRIHHRPRARRVRDALCLIECAWPCGRRWRRCARALRRQSKRRDYVQGSPSAWDCAGPAFAPGVPPHARCGRGWGRVRVVR